MDDTILLFTLYRKLAIVAALFSVEAKSPNESTGDLTTVLRLPCGSVPILVDWSVPGTSPTIETFESCPDEEDVVLKEFCPLTSIVWRRKEDCPVPPLV